MNVRERDFEEVGNVVFINVDKINGWFRRVLFGRVGEKDMRDYFGVMNFRVYGDDFYKG